MSPSATSSKLIFMAGPRAEAIYSRNMFNRFIIGDRVRGTDASMNTHSYIVWAFHSESALKDKLIYGEISDLSTEGWNRWT